MYFVQLFNEEKCGKLYINRRTSLQSSPIIDSLEETTKQNKQDQYKRQIFRRKSYTDCCNGKQASSYAAKVDALIPQSFISQHILEENNRILENNSKLGQMKASTFIKSVRFTAKMKRTKILKQGRASQANLEMERSPLTPRALTILGGEATRRNSKIITDAPIQSWKSQQVIYNPDEKGSNQKKILPSSIYSKIPIYINNEISQETNNTKSNSNNNENLLSVQRSQQKKTTALNRNQMVTSMDNILQIQNQDNDGFSIQVQQTESSKQKISHDQIPTLNNLIVRQTSINYIKESKEEIEGKDSTISQFQDEIIENNIQTYNHIILEQQISDSSKKSDSSPVNEIDSFSPFEKDQQDIKAQTQVQHHSESQKQEKKNNQDFSNLCQQEKNNKATNGFVKDIQLKPLNLEKLQQFTLKRQLSHQRESITSRSTTLNQNQSQQKFAYVTNYWRFVDKIHANSNQILQEMQTDRREQAQLLASQQITTIPIKKFHKKIIINFENMDPYKSLSSQFEMIDRLQTSRVKTFSSRQSSPSKNSKRILTPAQIPNPVKSSSSFHHSNVKPTSRPPSLSMTKKQQAELNFGNMVNDEEKYKQLLYKTYQNQKSPSSNLLQNQFKFDTMSPIKINKKTSYNQLNNNNTNSKKQNSPLKYQKNSKNTYDVYNLNSNPLSKFKSLSVNKKQGFQQQQQ